MPKQIVPWVGSKRKLADQILRLFPKHKCYAEPFAGSAALMFVKRPSHVEVINDINGELINLYRQVRDNYQALVEQLKYMPPSRELFNEEKAKMPEKLSDVQRAIRFYYLAKLAFGARMNNPTFGIDTKDKPSLNLLSLESDFAIAQQRLARVTIEQLPWQDIVTRYDSAHTLFYCDPPYWKLTGYGDKFPFAEYEQLLELAKGINAKMIISLNDHPDIRALFADLWISDLKIDYTVNSGSKRETSSELVICNFNVHQLF